MHSTAWNTVYCACALNFIAFRVSCSPMFFFGFFLVPLEGLRSQSQFDEMRTSYIRELVKAIGLRQKGVVANSQRFYQLTKLLDSMHDVSYWLMHPALYIRRNWYFLEIILWKGVVSIAKKQNKTKKILYCVYLCE